MVKKTLFKYSSVLLSVVLIASTLTGCGTSTADLLPELLSLSF